MLTINNVLEYLEHSEYVIPEIQKAIMFMIRLHPEAILERGYKKLSLESMKAGIYQLQRVLLYCVCY